MNLKQYLNNAINNLANNNIKHIVTGNEAADLDSVISALLLAYTYQISNKKNTLPLINIERKHFKLKTESKKFLQEFNITESNLIFFDDLPSNIFTGTIKITLVDHNKLPQNLNSKNTIVEAIFDHHTDLGLYPNANPRVFKKTASCASLIADFILKKKPEIFTKYENLAILNIAPVILDSLNLNTSYGKTTNFDLHIFNKLKSYTNIDTDKLYQKLRKYKTDIKGFTVTDLLNKDFKQWQHNNIIYGISSITIPAHKLLEYNHLQNEIDSFIKTKKLNLLIIMTAFNNGSFKRELIIISTNHHITKNLPVFYNNKGSYLEPANEKLKLENYYTAVFHQKNTQYSRKKIQPLTCEFLTKNYKQ
jgi:exopolyphosphatase